MQTKIISLEQKDIWNEIVANTLNYDFYHLNSYHSLDPTGSSFLFVVSKDSQYIAMPLIKRPIEGTPYFDCTSVYGYAGPITNCSNLEENGDLIALFKNELKEYCSKQKIVALFSRLHPLIDQSESLEGLGLIQPLNKTIAVDLRLSLEDQRKQYRKSNKSEIGQLRRKGFEVIIASNDEQIAAFVDIYTETMNRVDASSSYYFDIAYFKNFLNESDFSAQLMLAYVDNTIAAGAIFTITRNFMQYHLAGTRTEFIKQTPMKLILDEARHLGKSLNLQYLHLGGGVGGVDDDPLFRFKSGFSDLSFQFKVWKYIHNEQIYNELVEAKSTDKLLNSNYFPLYRG
jgi:lipid II:glycine glycyltransferase (peptidoglycan interpeptide bridge formation enzyme)